MVDSNEAHTAVPAAAGRPGRLPPAGPPPLAGGGTGSTAGRPRAYGAGTETISKASLGELDEDIDKIADCSKALLQATKGLRILQQRSQPKEPHPGGLYGRLAWRGPHRSGEIHKTDKDMACFMPKCCRDKITTVLTSMLEQILLIRSLPSMLPSLCLVILSCCHRGQVHSNPQG